RCAGPIPPVGPLHSTERSFPTSWPRPQPPIAISCALGLTFRTGMTDEAAGVHRGARRHGGVAGGGARAATGENSAGRLSVSGAANGSRFADRALCVRITGRWPTSAGSGDDHPKLYGWQRCLARTKGG